MKLVIRGILAAAVAACFLGSAFSGKPAWGAQYPQVASLHKFTIETNYMSLPGYLRYLTFVQDGTWISRKEAVRIVRQQAATASY